MGREQWRDSGLSPNKQKILGAIAKSEPEGRSTSELVRETGLHRDTVYTISKQLEEVDWIKKTDKYGRYHLTETAVMDPHTASWIFSAEVMSNFRKWYTPPSRPNKFSSFDSKDSDLVERELFEFGNKIGALITYILIQAIRPRDIRIKGSRNNQSAKKIKLSGKEKTEQARLWVEKTINPVRILFEFCRLPPVKKGLAVFGEDIPIEKSLPAEVQEKYRVIQKKRRKMSTDDPLWTDSELDEETFNKLTTAFANIYPEINTQLEYIRRTLPDKVQKHKEWDRKYFEEREKKT
jgi:hypothetical protein